MMTGAANQISGPGFINMSVLFEGLQKQSNRTSRLLQTKAAFLNPTPPPKLFIDPQSVKDAIKMAKAGMNINMTA